MACSRRGAAFLFVNTIVVPLFVARQASLHMWSPNWTAANGSSIGHRSVFGPLSGQSFFESLPDCSSAQLFFLCVFSFFYATSCYFFLRKEAKCRCVLFFTQSKVVYFFASKEAKRRSVLSLHYVAKLYFSLKSILFKRSRIATLIFYSGVHHSCCTLRSVRTSHFVVYTTSWCRVYTLVRRGNVVAVQCNRRLPRGNVSCRTMYTSCTP